MSAAVMTAPIAEALPRTTARIAGFFWLMTIVTGGAAMYLGRSVAAELSFRAGILANVLASFTYLTATLFVYVLLKPVSRNVSLLAALFSVGGCVSSVVITGLRLSSLVLLGGAPGFSAEQLRSLAALSVRLTMQAEAVSFAFFGVHCLLVGCLILRSTFIPRLVGALMVGAGVGWLTFAFSNLLSPPLVRTLAPYIFLPGIIGETVLTLWLLAAVPRRRAAGGGA